MIAAVFFARLCVRATAWTDNRKQPFTDQTLLSGGGQGLNWPHMGWRDSLHYSLVCAFLLRAQLQRSSQNDVATWFMFWFFLLCRLCLPFSSYLIPVFLFGDVI